MSQPMIGTSMVAALCIYVANNHSFQNIGHMLRVGSKLRDLMEYGQMLLDMEKLF